jgi:uncharacterized membrane protein YphA (DoxX/SURF4 family)
MMPEPRSPAYAFVALLLRVALGGVFLFAAYNKLGAPLSFSESIEAFHFDLPDWLTLLSTFAVPWTEVFCGVAIVLGLWSRAAATVFTLLIAVFTIGIVSAILRHLPLDCGCFGKFKLYCEGPIGWCKVLENLVLAAAALILVVCGGGRLALDRLFQSRATRAAGHS